MDENRQEDMETMDDAVKSIDEESPAAEAADGKSPAAKQAAEEAKNMKIETTAEAGKDAGKETNPDGGRSGDKLKKPIRIYILILAAVTLIAVIAGIVIYAVPVVRTISGMVTGKHISIPSVEIDGIDDFVKENVEIKIEKDLEDELTVELPELKISPENDLMELGEWETGSCEYGQNGEIVKIDVDVSMINLTVQSGDVLKAEWQCREMLLPEITEENGVLKIRQRDTSNLKLKFHLDDDSFFENLGAGLTVTVPAGVTLEELGIDVDCGNIAVTGVRSRSTKISADLGNIVLSGGSLGNTEVQADCGNIELIRVAAEKADLQADFGRVKMLESSFDMLDAEADCGQVLCTGVNAGSISLQADMGSIDVSGTFDMLSANCSLGSITVVTDKAEEEVRLDLSADLGSVTVNGKKW